MLSPWAIYSLFACGGTAPTPPPEPTPVPFALMSPAFDEGATIPLENECGPPIIPDGPGDNISPGLTWTAGPEGTLSYTLVVRDRDATPPQFPDGIIHWTLYNIPPEITSIPAGIPEGEDVSNPAGARQGEIQGSGTFGYFGPCSPSEVNSYEFTVHAMGEDRLSLGGDRSESNVAEVAETTALAAASLTGES